jgi:hypothetical protein
MQYTVVLTSREFEIIAEDFNFDQYHHNFYDSETRLALTREAWKGNVPLYFHDVGVFNPDYLKEKSSGFVTSDPIFAIFDKENITFAEMLDEIWKRRKKLVKTNPGDENPYA